MIQRFFSPSACRGLTCVLAVAGLAGGLCLTAAAEQVDTMDMATNFYNITDKAALVEADGTVTFRKIASGDAFVRWSLDSPSAMALTDENDRLEVNFAGFPEGGSVETLLYVDDAQGPKGKPKKIEWLKKHNTPGPVVIESVRELAKANGVVEPAAYHLFFRIKNDPKGAVQFDSIRVSAKGAAPAAEPQNTGGMDIAEIIFSESPKESGITFDRAGAKPTKVKRGGGEEDAWVVEQPVGPGKQWQRPFRFDITDPAFADGKRASIDIEVTYMLNAWGGVQVTVDTQQGPEIIENLWGNSGGKWKTKTVRLDTARLAGNVDGKFDLKLAGDNGPLLLKRVRVVGYNPSENVQWDRMLEVASTRPVGSAASPLFVFGQQSAAGIGYDVRNHAAVAPPMRYQVRVLSDAGETVYQDRGPVKVAAGGETPLELTFDTTDWPLGPYTAEVNLFLEAGDDQRPAFAFSTLLGVISDAQVGKARPGEFMFGLDPGGQATSPEGLAFYRVMGVDLLRNGLNDSGRGTLDDFQTAHNTLAAEGVAAMVMMDPPGQMETITDDKRKEMLQELLPRLEEIARVLTDRVTYFELGNEPDLPFFYPGTMEQYNDCFAQMSDAIHRGNPNAVVMNGGLCFFGEDGDRRAREFIKLVDMSKLDMWAYHGHGQGGEAERAAYDRQVEAVKAHDKETRPYLDTETGMSASSPAQYREQSRTGVQKMVFAHAKGMPSLMWFRLFMGQKGYTLSHNRVEPRPTILSYRTMVERLRHVRFARMLDADAPELELYLFDEIDASGQPTGQKTLVAWSNGVGRRSVSLRLDEPAAKIESPTLYDLYGNATPVTDSGGVVSLGVGINPVYLTWRSGGTMESVASAPPALEPESVPPFVATGENKTLWLVRNDSEEAMDLTLRVEAKGGESLEVLDPEVSLQASPHTLASVPVRIRSQGEARVALPRWWHVFTNLNADRLEKMSTAQLSEIPDTLPGTAGPVAAQRIWVENQRIDLASLSGGYREKQPALLFAAVDAPADMQLQVGAAADWWMRWSVNGQMVYDTFEKGNGGNLSLTAHQFALPLKKGRNVIAVQVLSGTAGFALMFGGEKDIATAEAGGLPPDRLEATLFSGNRTLAQQIVPLTFQQPLPSFADLKLEAPLEDWLEHEPFAVLGDAQVTNFHEAHPDKTRWYQGPDDLSAILWFRQDAGSLELVVAVRDQAASNPPAATAAGADLSKFDALEVLGYREADGQEVLNMTIAPTAGEPLVHNTHHTGQPSVSVQRPGPTTPGWQYVYRVRWPDRSDQPNRLSLKIHDADDSLPKQSATSATWQIAH